MKGKAEVLNGQFGKKYLYVLLKYELRYYKQIFDKYFIFTNYNRNN